MQQSIILLLFLLKFISCGISQDRAAKQKYLGSITGLEMHLNAYGVESDDFPSVDVYIDFKNDSSQCLKSYYNPKYKPSTYRLSSREIKSVLELLVESDSMHLRAEYKVSSTDQPTSTTIIYKGDEKFIIKDYGLQGEYPLPELYKVVYKF